MPPFRSLTVACSALVLTLAACSSSDDGASTSTTTAASSATGSDSEASESDEEISSSAQLVAENAATHEDAADGSWDEAAVVDISLDGTTATASADGVTVDGSTVTITAAGTYRLAGTLTDGQIVVDSEDAELVRLVLDGVDITSSSSTAVNVVNAEKIVVVLADGSQNSLVDASSYELAADSDEPNAALFSSADLTITGSGALAVDGNYNDGIASKDGLVITGGAITVAAVDDGIRGKDYVVIMDATITVDASGDGVKADNDEDASMGYVLIESGAVEVTAGGDGIDAATDAIVTGGELRISSGGGSSATVSDDLSAKGIKGSVGVAIGGGETVIDAADDAVHSNGSITVDAGAVTISTGDDALHADAALTVNGGTIDVAEAYEGLESLAITIAGGDIDVVSSDDALNAAGGVDGSGTQVAGGQPGSDGFGGGSGSITISGGTVLLDSQGDGVDANGSVTMTGGTVLVDGPTANGNGALDYDGTFDISGGVLVAAGSAGMAMAPSTSSSQLSLLVNFTSAQDAGTALHVEASDGGDVLTFVPSKDYQSLLVSTADLTAGVSYDVYVGGTPSGTAVAAGLYEAGAYSPGTLVDTTTTDEAASQTAGMGAMGGRGGMGGRP